MTTLSKSIVELFFGHTKVLNETIQNVFPKNIIERETFTWKNVNCRNMIYIKVLKYNVFIKIWMSFV